MQGSEHIIFFAVIAAIGAGGAWAFIAGMRG